MRPRLRGERRGVQQYGDPGRAGQGGEVRFAVVIEVCGDQRCWADAHRESYRRLKCPVAIAEQNGDVTRLGIGVVSYEESQPYRPESDVDAAERHRAMKFVATSN